MQVKTGEGGGGTIDVHNRNAITREKTWDKGACQGRDKGKFRKRGKIGGQT